MIPVDDLNDWIGVLGGHPQTITPNLDCLARSGVLFSNAHYQAPACNPSRASLMTGIRPTTSAVYRNGDLWRDGLPDAVTLPEHFRASGYHVVGGRKTFHGSQNDLSVWDDYYSFDTQIRPPNRPVNGIPRAAHFDWSAIDVPDQETADTKLANWADAFLRQDHDKPFFLACGFFRPHLPWYAPKKHFDRFPPEETILPHVLANDLDDVPPAAKSRSRRDHDNVTSTKVVMMMTAPGVTKLGGVCSRPAELLDIYPTLSELCELPERPEFEGKSLVPLLKSPDAAWDKPAISSNGPDMTTVRTQRWRYSSFVDGEELYDHENDPSEWKNLAEDPRLEQIKTRLRRHLPSNVNRTKLKQYVRPTPRNW